MSALVTLICGYRRTGKDRLYDILVNKPCDRFKWRIYKSPSSYNHTFNQFPKYKHISFASELKQEAAIEYGIPAIISDDEKDIKQFDHPTSNMKVSARDIYIEWGSVRRAQDINYWCNKALKQVPHDPDMNCVITDWRFTNEIECAIKMVPKVVSVRVYRSDVPVPPMDVQSEHELDKYKTDFLLVCDNNHEEEFKRAVEIFPQYSNYLPEGVI